MPRSSCLGRADVMSHLSDWRAGKALGARTRVMVGSSSAFALITVPRCRAAVVRARRLGRRAILVER
jgi:hypothetical protein